MAEPIAVEEPAQQRVAIDGRGLAGCFVVDGLAVGEAGASGLGACESEAGSLAGITAFETGVKDYWEGRAASFGLDGRRIDAWGALMQEQLAGATGAAGAMGGEPCRVLDVGCGTGAMGLTLAVRGHEVCGIDFSENMLAHARENARALGVAVEYRQALADGLPFASGSFDAVVHRNVLWCLSDPDAAMEQWAQALRPGGLLIYFDSDWYGYLHDAERAALRAREYGSGPVANAGDMERAAYDLPLTWEERPAWDCAHLPEHGFRVLEARDVSADVWTPEERVRMSFAPQFMVVARRESR